MKKLLALLLTAALLCSMLAACGTKTEEGAETTASTDANVTYDLEGAAAYVQSLYKEDLTVTAVDFNVVSQVMIAGVTYQIDWSVDTDKVTVGAPTNGIVTVDVNEKSPEEVSYKLTATIKAGNGSTKKVTFKLTVPKYEVNSHAEYLAAAKGDTVTVEGIVVAINSKDAGNKYNHLFLADTSVDGGYYCYSITQDPVKDLGIKVGMTVKVTGPIEPYAGMQEIKGGQVAIVDSTIKEVKTLDITEKFASGASLGAYVGLPVVIKDVSIGSQDLEKDTSQYLYFSIGEKQGYVRTYVTDFPTTLKADDKAAIDADHAAHFGFKADVTGILVLYNDAPYLIPLSTTPFTNYKEVTYTPADKVAAEKDALNLGTSFSDDTVIDLSATGKYYDDVKITWATNNATNAAIADGKLTIVVPDNAITVTVTATITCGDVTETKVFEIALSKAPVTIPEALQIPDGSNVLVSGTVKEINTEWSEQYGNISVTIVDADGNTLYVYRLKTNVKVGDVITVKGTMGTYNGARQVAAGSTATIDDPAPIEVTIPEALETPDNQRVVVKGTVKSIDTAWSEQYKNISVTIEDADGKTLYIYRLATNVNVGDVITVSGRMATYKEARQIAAGATAVIESGDAPAEPAAPVEVTIPEALETADGVEVIVKGTVKEINTEWNEQYGNITVTIEDAEGNTLYIYRLKTNVKVGDKVTITGKVGSYNGAKQIAAGATAEIEAGPVIIPELGVDDFSKEKPAAFENAIVIEGVNCETNSTVVELKATQFHLYNIDSASGAAAHGVTKLDQSGVFHYYIDLGNVNKTIASNEGDDKKIAALEDCYIRWTFTVTEAGTYTVGSYMRLKDNSNRSCQVQFDDQTPLIMHYTLDSDLSAIKDDTHGTYLTWDGVEVELEAGEHTITYSIPSEEYRTSTSSWHWRTIFLMKKA